MLEYKCVFCGKTSTSASNVEPCPKRINSYRHVWKAVTQ